MDTGQWKSKRSKLDEIHTNSYEIRTKFVRSSYEFRTNFCEFRPICSFCLARCPSTAGACGLGATGAFGGLGVLLRQSGPGLVLALGVVPNIRRPSGERDLHADVGRCARQKLRKGEWTRGNGRAKGANWTKFTEIRTKFVRNWNEFRTNFTSRENSHKFIHVKFVRNSYEFRTNFT